MKFRVLTQQDSQVTVPAGTVGVLTEVVRLAGHHVRQVHHIIVPGYSNPPGGHLSRVR